MSVVITGGAGFIGSNYARRLLDGTVPPSAAPERVVVLDALTYAGGVDNLAPVADDPRLEFVHGDVRDADCVSRVLCEADTVVHFAAESHVDRSITGSADFVTTNVLGTHVMLQASLDAGVRRFVHVSTDEVYGSVETGSSRADDPLEPNSPYSASKASSDLLARAFHRTHGLPVCITRCSNNYGPHQNPEKLVPRFVTTLLDGGSVPLYGDGGNVRDWLHVDDHCAAVRLVARSGRPGATYNVGGGRELTNLELTELLLAETGRDPSHVRRVADRPGHDRRYAVDDRLIRDELGYAPSVPFERGLAETVAWYRDNRAWWERRTAATEGAA